MTNATSLWVEKYRPKTIDDYVWRDLEFKAKVEQWVAAKAVPHVLFSGRPGVGKTSLAYLILELLDVPTQDILFIPASRERKIDDIIERVQSFVKGWAWGDSGIKYVIIDEADSISQAAQRTLRADMEIYEQSVRFIFTCNYPKRIIEPIHSRVEHYVFNGLDRDAFEMRLAEIMMHENIDATEESVAVMRTIASRTYPDLRKAINVLQQCSYVTVYANQEGETAFSRDLIDRPYPSTYLKLPDEEETVDEKPYLYKVADYVFAGRITEARQILVNSATVDDYVGIYRWMYENLDLWGKEDSVLQGMAVVAINEHLYKHGTVADPEINLIACFVKLRMDWQDHGSPKR